MSASVNLAGADPGFLERGFVHVGIKIWGIRFAEFISFS